MFGKQFALLKFLYFKSTYAHFQRTIYIYIYTLLKFFWFHSLPCKHFNRRVKDDILRGLINRNKTCGWRIYEKRYVSDHGANYSYLYITKSWNITFIFATLLLRHISSHVIYLFIFIFFSLFKLFFPVLKKKKTLLLPISSHIYYYISSCLSLSFLLFYLPTTLPLYFLPLFYIV